MSVHQSDADQNTSDDVPETGRNVPKRFTYDTFGVPKVEPVLAQAKVVNPVRYCSTAYLWLNMPSRKLSNCAVEDFRWRKSDDTRLKVKLRLIVAINPDLCNQLNYN